MLKIIDYVLSGALMSAFVLYMLSKLSGNKINFKSWKTYFVFVLLGMVQFLNYYYVNGYLKILIITIIVAIICYFYFKRSKKEAIITSIFTELIIILSEFIFSFFIIFLSSFNFSDIVNKYFGTGMSIINLIISIISCLLVQNKIINRIYKIILKKTDKISDKFIIIVMMLIMITVNVIYSSAYYKLNIKYLLTINIILQIIYVYIILKILNEKERYIRISSKYNVTISNLRELRDIVVILKKKGHENRNHFQTIRDMIKKHDKDINVISYIDTLLGDKLKDDEKLRIETSIITNSELSSLVYSKMITMKDIGIHTSLHVDKALEKLNLYDLDDIMTLYICKIIGVWLDNAIEAVSGLKTKNVELHMYLDLDNNLKI